MSRPLARHVARSIAAGIGLAALSPPARLCAGSHVVVRGDTLSRIAWRCRSSVAAIARASGIADPDLIRVGQRLLIPGGRPAAAPAPAAAAAGAARPGGYRIQATDTLYSLARWARTSLPALLAANPGSTRTRSRSATRCACRRRRRSALEMRRAANAASC